jgi:hypothetical protein
MHRVEMLEELLALAAQLGYTVRQEWLGGRGGGACEIAGRRYLFIDLALNVTEQLAQAAEALAEDPALVGRKLPAPLAAVLSRRRAA